MNNLGINQQEASFGEKVFQFSSMWGLDFWFQPPPPTPSVSYKPEDAEEIPQKWIEIPYLHEA